LEVSMVQVVSVTGLEKTKSRACSMSLFVIMGGGGFSFPSPDFSVVQAKKVASPEKPSRHTRFFNFIVGLNKDKIERLKYQILKR
jgi:hypothetical protein